MKKFLFPFLSLVTLVLTGGLPAAAGIEPSQTLPADGMPEHRYTMKNAQGYYCNSTTSPTKNSSRYAEFAFYESGVSGAYYLYNVTAGKWVSYDKKSSYSARTGFVKMTADRVDGAYYKFRSLGGNSYDISPYKTGGVAAIYLNWYRGVGSDNPADGSVTLGLWTDDGNKDKGSNWTFDEVGVVYTWTLFSDGMPADAAVTVLGQTFRGLNAQGDQTIDAARLTADDVTVTVGGGYVAEVVVDNDSHQLTVRFVQLFLPTEAVDATEQHPYLLKMPLAYIRKTGSNVAHTKTRSEADRFLFIEKTLGQYLLYDLTAGCYITYTSVANGSNVGSTSQSNVRTTISATSAKTWQLLRVTDATVAIVPGKVEHPSGSSPALNFTGGIAQNCVLNLYRADDSNSAWEIIDPTAGSMACATLLYALPGAPFIHKLVPNEGEKVTGVDFGNLTTLILCHDREEVGNRYSYIRGTAPTDEGEYGYTLLVSGSDGSETQVKVRLVVSRFLQSPTPMMGWLTWNWFARSISHDKMVAIARGMEKHGLIDAGYGTIVLDDAWGEPTTDKKSLTYDKQKFPKGISGLKAALQEVNSSLKVGIYSDAGCMTCENYQPGSYLHESDHLALFDSWGVDMLKYDYCNSEASTQISYGRMGSAVAALNERRKAEGGIPFVFNICEWGKTSPWLWGAEAGGSSWRATSDAREDWIGNASRPGVLGGVDETRHLWMYAGVNRFNDLDMMCIGLHGLGGPSNNTMSHMSNGGKITGLTDAQARSQMSLWCMMASPLSLTCDLRENPKGEANSNVTLPKPLITDADITTLTNREVLAINQDTLGQQAEYMEALSTGTTNYSTTGYDVYVKDLTQGRMAVAVTNRGAQTQKNINLPLKALYLQEGTEYRCREVWAGQESVIEDTLATGSLAAYETKVFVLTPAGDLSSVSTLKILTDATVYDLQGRPMAQQREGIFIKGNRKHLVK